MKEATGELNMTVITVVAIAAVGLLFTIFVWPMIQANLSLNTACSQGPGFSESTAADGKWNGTADGISCANMNATETSYKCYARYNGKTYSKNCGNSSDTTKTA